MKQNLLNNKVIVTMVISFETLLHQQQAEGKINTCDTTFGSVYGCPISRAMCCCVASACKQEGFVCDAHRVLRNILKIRETMVSVGM